MIDRRGLLAGAAVGLVGAAAALSLFVKKEKGHWILEKPRIFRDEMMIDAAVSQLRVSCGGKVFLMGRQAGVYESLRLIPKMVLDVMSDRRS